MSARRGNPVLVATSGGTGLTERAVEALVAAYASGDVDALLAALDDDVRYRQNSSSEQAAFWADCRGKEAFMEALGDISSDWELLRYEMIDMIASGERAAVRSDAQMRHRETGKVVRAEVALFLRLKGGKVTEIIEFHDSLLIAERS